MDQTHHPVSPKRRMMAAQNFVEFMPFKRALHPTRAERFHWSARSIGVTAARGVLSYHALDGDIIAEGRFQVNRYFCNRTSDDVRGNGRTRRWTE